TNTNCAPLIVGPHFYVFFSEYFPNLDPVGISVARALVTDVVTSALAESATPATPWRKYSGGGTWNLDALTFGNQGTIVLPDTQFTDHVRLLHWDGAHSNALGKHLLLVSTFAGQLLMFQSSDGLTWPANNVVLIASPPA